MLIDDTEKLIEGDSLIEGGLAWDKNGTTLIHIVNLDTGEVQTVDTGEYFITMH